MLGLFSPLETLGHTLSPALHTLYHYFAELTPTAYLAVKEKLKQFQSRLCGEEGQRTRQAAISKAGLHPEAWGTAQAAFEALA